MLKEKLLNAQELVCDKGPMTEDGDRSASRPTGKRDRIRCADDRNIETGLLLTWRSHFGLPPQVVIQLD